MLFKDKTLLFFCITLINDNIGNSDVFIANVNHLVIFGVESVLRILD